MIKSYRDYLNESHKGLTEEQISFLDLCCKDNWKFNESTGLVDLFDDFKIPNYSGIKNLQGIKFGKAQYDFRVSFNPMTSLEGCPEIVSGYFSCSETKVTSLEGGPKETHGYNCKASEITNLKGAPKIVHGDFFCSINELTSLEGGPIGVEGNYECSRNKLTSLVGSPERVGQDFFCYDNQLKNLLGAPKSIDGDLDCESNDIESFQGIPEFIGGKIIYKGNPIYDAITKADLLELGFSGYEANDKKLFFYMLANIEKPSSEDVNRILTVINRTKNVF